MQARLLLLTLLLATPLTARADDLIVLLQQGSCPDCGLADVDLVHADLRDADLSNAKLMRANLSQAELDGADLSGADLSFTNLRGASLRGADLTGSRLYGTDLRDADLSEALLSPRALEKTYWRNAQGISVGSRSHAALHNAGVAAFEVERWSEAEQLFSTAILNAPTKPLSWVARGITRIQQGKNELAALDFNQAASIYQKNGQNSWSNQLTEAAQYVLQDNKEAQTKKDSNGLGSKIIRGTISSIKILAPLAAKVMLPIGIGL